MLDIALVSIPRLSIEVPPLNISQLKSCLTEHNYTAKCFDFNIALYNFLNFEEWLEIDNYFQTDLRYTGNDVNFKKRDIEFFTMCKKKNKNITFKEKYLQFMDSFFSDIIKNYNPKIIGLSVFSVNSVIPCVDICKFIKNKYCSVKILLGGMGVSSFGVGSRPNFGEFMIKNELADYFISGEGESKIVNFMSHYKNNYDQNQLENLNTLPIPDYQDYNFDNYPGKTNLVYITGSRGCVRKCSFCDINNLWKKYKFRNSDHILKEMLEIYKKYNTTEFYFTDSLINGNLKVFHKLCEDIIQAKKEKQLPPNLMWGGQWITRTTGSLKEEDYILASESGLYNLSIGVESGSTKVLQSIGKGITREDYDTEFFYLDKYGIRFNMLMIIGYPTETDIDFQETLDMFTKYKDYSDNGTIWGVNLGKTLVILPGSSLGANPSDYGIDFLEDGNWINNSTGLDYATRIKRRMIAQEHLEKLGYVIKSTVTTINSLHTIVMDGGYDTIS